MFKNILVPLDGSPLSARAVKRAVALAKEQKARVTGYHVGPEWSPRSYSEVWAGNFTQEQHSEMVRKLASKHFTALEQAAHAAGVDCKCLYTEGAYPYEKIVLAARKHHCDLIVMASHGRRGVSRLLLGSETGKVLALSKVPVMVCR